MLHSSRTALLLLLAAFPAWLHGDSLANAWRARALLGPETWARVIRVENDAQQSAYPHEVFALVFEFGGLLWFYTDTNGTQSFSLHRNNLAAEKTDFAPLLRDIEPGFDRYTTVPPPANTQSGDGELPNGCFIESIAALRERLAGGEAILRAKLLSYYAEVAGRRQGHTVLVIETLQGVFVIDPDDDEARRRCLRVKPAPDALALAQRLRPDLEIARARWVPASGSTMLASTEGGGARNGRAL